MQKTLLSFHWAGEGGGFVEDADAAQLPALVFPVPFGAGFFVARIDKKRQGQLDIMLKST